MVCSAGSAKRSPNVFVCADAPAAQVLRAIVNFSRFVGIQKKQKEDESTMWKMLLLFVLPLLTPFEIAYALIMKVLRPLGVPDFLGILND